MYKLGVPITWREFRGYPKDKQEDYYLSIVSEHKITRKMFATMLGCTYGAFVSFCYDNELVFEFPRAVSRAVENDFEKWLDSFKEPAVVEEPVVEKAEVVVTKTEVVKLEDNWRNTLTTGAFTMRGTGAEISGNLFTIFRDTKMEVDIQFRLIEEGE